MSFKVETVCFIKKRRSSIFSYRFYYVIDTVYLLMKKN